jgi:hypothetical protein
MGRFYILNGVRAFRQIQQCIGQSFRGPKPISFVLFIAD